MSEGKHAPQILQIEPSRELTFVGPFTDVVNSSLNLRNPSDKSVCFKVKTTAPKQYCVRPNSGIIQPGQSKQITVMLQPLDGLNTAEVGRHKFMVQTCYTPAGEVDLDKVWKDVDATQLMYSKLTVVFDSAHRTSASPQYVREETPASIQYSSPSASIPSLKSNDSGRVPAGFDLDSQLHSEIALRKKAESEKSVLSKEIQELFKKNTKLQQENERSSLTEVGVPTIQVILAIIAALLLGLIIGRLF